ncbi:MAG TPA: L-rhamnose mutarotase [Solibacterales bacterium]|nr:L-rhamnose mutarotase [Bryobacterales bacterium]
MSAVRRFGQVLGLRPEHEAKYIRYHAAVWPEVLELIRDCHIRNYSIFLKDHRLFAYFEYTGSDYEADMARMAGDRRMQEWWAIMEPMQEPLATRQAGEWWSRMEEVFHTD